MYLPAVAAQPGDLEAEVYLADSPPNFAITDLPHLHLGNLAPLRHHGSKDLEGLRKEGLQAI